MVLKFYAIYLIVLSLVTFTVYAVDKNRAKQGKWRISEAALLLLSFLGGGIGGYLAMHAVRHKTRKWYFHFVNLIGIFWQIAVLILLI